MSRPSIPRAVLERVRVRAGDRCGYCLASQHLVFGWLEIEHIVSRAHGGSDDESNLWLACRFCNNYKNDQLDGLDDETAQRVRLFDPSRDHWAEHFDWDADGIRVVGRTPMGRVTVASLRMNNKLAVTVRRSWVAAGWHPPAESEDESDITPA